MTDETELGHLPLRSAKGNKPCPFCGSTQLALVVHNPTQKPVLIECETCGASGPIAATEKQLAALWNMRFAADEVPQT